MMTYLTLDDNNLSSESTSDKVNSSVCKIHQNKHTVPKDGAGPTSFFLPNKRCIFPLYKLVNCQ